MAKKFYEALGVSAIWSVLCFCTLAAHNNGLSGLTAFCMIGAFVFGYAVPVKVFAWSEDALGEPIATPLSVVLMVICVGATSWIFTGLVVPYFILRVACMVTVYGLVYATTKSC